MKQTTEYILLDQLREANTAARVERHLVKLLSKWIEKAKIVTCLIGSFFELLHQLRKGNVIATTCLFQCHDGA